jgi:predicted dehydrogenase
MCRSGEYGKLKVVNCHISQAWYQLTAGKWRRDPALSGGGMLYDSGAHVLNTLVWTVESDVEEVHAYVDCLDAEVDINGTINVRFENGVIACVAVCGEAPGSSSGMWNFEQATAIANPWFGGDLKLTVRRDGQQGEEDPKVTREDSSAQKNFIDALVGKDEAVTSARNGVILSELMDAIYESARTGQPAKPGGGTE